ncbi:ATP-binding protein [candidate division KSB1 bacterium]
MINKQYSLRFKIATILITVSLLTLFLMGMGSWIVFGRLLDQKALEMQKNIVESHANAIESYLADRLNSLRLLAMSCNLDDIKNPRSLQNLLDCLNRTSNGGYIDLGIIGSNGDHLAYVGEYDLIDKNYREADWFHEVSIRGEYISDVFLGFRQTPHCIIAVKSYQDSDFWILRATIDSEQFDAYVKKNGLGETGDAYILNKEGFYQTSPKVGAILDSSPITDLSNFQGLQSRRERVGDTTKIQVITWVNGDKWLLVVEQDESEIRAPVNRAIVNGFLVLLIGVGFIVVTTLFATKILSNQIAKANKRREEMNRAFIRSAKLASIGELATGLAHEINNPLAIISADQTNISDLISEIDTAGENVSEVLVSVERSKRQIERCKNITTKILQFGRKRDSESEYTDIANNLKETIEFLNKQAHIRNIELSLNIDEDIPLVMIDPVELEQVIVNLFQNSFHALSNGGLVNAEVYKNNDEVIIEVKDNGPGIAPEILERIFEPFFTTKPVGQGTGLGLSVCYGIVQSWGGRIDAESIPGKGATMRIHIPVNNSLKS